MFQTTASLVTALFLLSPPQGPYISEIRLLTPYAQAVDISRHKTLGYSAQQAEAEYK